MNKYIIIMILILMSYFKVLFYHEFLGKDKKVLITYIDNLGYVKYLKFHIAMESLATEDV